MIIDMIIAGFMFALYVGLFIFGAYLAVMLLIFAWAVFTRLGK